MSNEVEKVVIIGGGPAGLGAALYAARANLSPLVFAGSPSGGQLMLTTEVENYLGFKSVLGPELITKMREHVEAFGARIRDENILSVDFSSNNLSLSLLDGIVTAKTVIIATGSKALWLEMPSETRLRGKGVSACATCDGFFFKNKIIAVVGGGDTAMEEALTLTNFASKVYLIHRKDSFRASIIMQQRVKEHEKIEIIMNTGIEEVLGENKVEGIRIKTVNASGTGTERTIELSGLFIAIGHKPDTEIFKGKIDLDERGYIISSARMAEDMLRAKRMPDGAKLEEIQKVGYYFGSHTSIHGVFAAGDCVDYAYRQASTAMGMGVAAALDAQRYLEFKGK